MRKLGIAGAVLALAGLAACASDPTAPVQPTAAQPAPGTPGGAIPAAGTGGRTEGTPAVTSASELPSGLRQPGAATAGSGARQQGGGAGQTITSPSQLPPGYISGGAGTAGTGRTQGAR
jgi:hypothetical protein